MHLTTTDGSTHRGEDQGDELSEELSDLALRILAFEGSWWQDQESKDRQIRARFDLTAVRYYQLLNRLIDLPAARVVDPLVVKRLQRLRARRARTLAAAEPAW